MVQAFTRAPVTQWDPCIGGKFVLFDGMISGEFQQLVRIDGSMLFTQFSFHRSIIYFIGQFQFSILLIIKPFLA